MHSQQCFSKVPTPPPPPFLFISKKSGLKHYALVYHNASNCSSSNLIPLRRDSSVNKFLSLVTDIQLFSSGTLISLAILEFTISEKRILTEMDEKVKPDIKKYISTFHLLKIKTSDKFLRNFTKFSTCNSYSCIKYDVLLLVHDHDYSDEHY